MSVTNSSNIGAIPKWIIVTFTISLNLQCKYLRMISSSQHFSTLISQECFDFFSYNILSGLCTSPNDEVILYPMR